MSSSTIESDPPGCPLPAWAIVQFERAASVLDTDPVVFDHLGEAYFKRHEFEKARKNWERALTLEPNDKIQSKLHQLLSHKTAGAAQ